MKGSKKTSRFYVKNTLSYYIKPIFFIKSVCYVRYGSNVILELAKND